MSCFNLPKKLKQLPSSSKKAWKSLTSTLTPKLRHIRNHSLDLTRATTRRLLDLCATKRHRRPPPPRGAARGGAAFYHYKSYNYNYNNYYYQHFQPSSSVPNSPATVYVDRLFGESPYSKEANTTGAATEAASTSGGSGGALRSSGGGGGDQKKRKTRKRCHNNSNNNNNNTSAKNNNNWKEYISSMPTIKGVDERAEEFISNFRQQIEIQREQSLIEFQEMLARSA